MNDEVDGSTDHFETVLTVGLASIKVGYFES